ncbi:glycosyltransferase family 4 protein [Bifidobacterium dentium]|uniref:glycosyltransferase family 4 protein n=1 Tax=Bifidobacterium dentium TaxID=1689 RepID=UPI003D16FBD6
MHIGFFSGDITRSGGTENVSIMIANELLARTYYEISFVSLFEEHDSPFFSIDPSIRRFELYPTVTHGMQHYFDTCRRLRNIVDNQHIDVLIDIDGILDMYSLPVKHSTGVKVVSWEHFNYLQNPGVPYRKLTRRWAARRADAIVTLTETDRKLYEGNLKLKCPIMAIANPMGTPTEVSYDADSRLILSSGRLTYQKGFDLLVKVASKVLPNHPDWQWMVLGEGEDRPVLEQMIHDASLDNQLVLEGRVDDMDSYYRRSAMFVMTSRFEGLPMVLLEAKAHRLPLISFDCPTGPSEVIEDGVNGAVVPLGDIDTMAATINTLIDDRAKRVEYSSMSGSNAERYDMATIFDGWRWLLRSFDSSGTRAD